MTDVLPSWRALVAAALLVGGLLAVTYGPSLRNSFVAWDDLDLIAGNPAAQDHSLAGLRKAFGSFDPELYTPLTFLSYQLDSLLWGTNAFGYHLTNLLLHGGNAMLVLLLVWLLLQQRKVSDVSDVTEVTKGKWNVGNLGNVGYLGNLFQDRAHVWALFAGTLFLLHPLHTEVVAWASARKDVLSGTFALLSAVLFLLHLRSGGRMAYRLSVLAFALSLLAKVSPVLLPIPLALLAIREGKSAKDALRMVAPFLLVSALLGAVALLGKSSAFGLMSGDAPSLLFLSMASLLRRFVWPIPLSLFYPAPDPVSLWSASFVFPVFVVFLLIAAAWMLRRRLPDAAIGLAWFFILLLPTAAMLYRGKDIAEIFLFGDHHGYLPSVGLVLAVASVLSRGRDVSDVPERKQNVGSVGNLGNLLVPLVIIAALLVLGTLSHRQAAVWRDTESLFSHVTEFYPQSHTAHTALAGHWKKSGRTGDAIREYETALELKETAGVFHNLGVIALETGDLPRAEGLLVRALSLDPLYTPSRLNLGVIAVKREDWRQAEETFRTVLEQDPRAVVASFNLGVVLEKQGRLAEAQDLYEGILRQTPGVPIVEQRLAAVTAALQK